MTKQLFFVAAVVKQDKLHKFMTFLEDIGAMNLEIKSVRDDAPSDSKTVATISTGLDAGRSVTDKRTEVINLLKDQGAMRGIKIANSVTFSMKNPTGFLSSMVNKGMIFQNKTTKEYSA